MEQYLILGLLQGATEWLPVSSEGILFLASGAFFEEESFAELLERAVFLHLGTALAATVYFSRELWRLFKGLLRYGQQDQETKSLIRFLAVATLVSAGLGLILLRFLTDAPSGTALMAFIGGLLVLTGLVQLFSKQRRGTKGLADLSLFDSVLLGLAQGFAILPGVSRSGFTVAALLLRRFDDELALKISFLMSIPAILGANVFLGWNGTSFSLAALAGLGASFLVGLLTIHALLSLARKLPFGWFVFGFGALVLGYALVA